MACTIIKDENFEDSKKMKGKSKKKKKGNQEKKPPILSGYEPSKQ